MSFKTTQKYMLVDSLDSILKNQFLHLKTPTDQNLRNKNWVYAEFNVFQVLRNKEFFFSNLQKFTPPVGTYMHMHRFLPCNK